MSSDDLGYDDLIEVKITNWEKYQGKKDYKRRSWFRVEDTIFQDLRLLEMDVYVYVVVLSLLCEVNKTSGTLCGTCRSFARKYRFRVSTLRKYVKKLNDVGFLTFTTVSKSAPTIHNITEHNRTQHNITEHSLTRAKNTASKSKNKKTKNVGDSLKLSKKVLSPLQELCKKIWEEYEKAYFERYKVEPVRNARVNAQIKQFAERVGSNAPSVLANYVRSSNRFYIQKGHAIGVALIDAEKLATEWRTGTDVTFSESQKKDKQSSIDQTFKNVLNDYERMKNGKRDKNTVYDS